MELTRLQQLAGLQVQPAIPLFECTTLFEGVDNQDFLIETYQEFESLFAELSFLLEDVTLTHAQIDALFKNVETYLNSDKAEVSNRNVWGKSIDSIRAKLKELLNWKKGKNKAGIVRNFDKVIVNFEQQLEKSNIVAKVKSEAIKIIDDIKDFGKTHPIAQKALIQIGTALVAVQNSSTKVQQIVIPALGANVRKSLTDETGINSLAELLFNEGEAQLTEQLAFIDAWNQNTTLADFAKEQPEMVKAIRKYPDKVAKASSKLINEKIVCSIFTEQKGEAKWSAAYKRFSSQKSKFFVWKNGVYYAGDLNDISDLTFKQIAAKVETQPDAESAGKVNVVESQELTENFITDFFGKMKDKVKSWQAKKGESNSNFTTIVTYDKIERAWVKAGKPKTLDEVEQFLTDYLTKAYGKSHHLAIHKMLDEFFNELRDELESKADTEQSNDSESESSNNEDESENKPASAEKVSNKNNNEPSDSGSSSARSLDTEESSTVSLSSEEKTLLKQLFLAIKNGKGDIAKDLASHMHKRNVLYKALAKVYAPHGVKIEESQIQGHVNELLLEDYRNKAGLGKTGFSELIKVLERQTKYW